MAVLLRVALVAVTVVLSGLMAKWFIGRDAARMLRHGNDRDFERLRAERTVRKVGMIGLIAIWAASGLMMLTSFMMLFVGMMGVGVTSLDGLAKLAAVFLVTACGVIWTNQVNEALNGKTIKGVRAK